MILPSPLFSFFFAFVCCLLLLGSHLLVFTNQESKINIGLRSIFCILEKAEPKWWNKLLRGKTPHYVKVDWDKWVDEDEDTSPG